MASFVNGCVFTATSSGTGSFVVSAAVTGWQTPAQAGASNGATYRYRAYSADNTQWEIGSGVYTTGTVTLTRVLIEASSNGGAATNFTLPPAVALTMFDEDLVPFASPAFTGAPTSTTAAVDTNTTQIATTAYVVAQAAAAAPLGDAATAVVGTSTRYARADHVHPGREVLTANRTYYVRTDGSNSNTGLVNTSGGAFLTIAKAIEVVAGLDRSTFDVTIQVGAGTFTAGGTINPWGPGSKRVKIIGAGATTIISTTAVDCFYVFGIVHMQDMKLQTGGGYGAGIRANPHADVTFQGLDFGACASSQMFASAGAAVIATGNYSISGGAPYHISARFGAYVEIYNRTITITGTPAYAGAYVQCDQGAAVENGACTFSGSATGKRYDASSLGIISSSGGGTSYFPGNVAGTGTNPSVSPYGLYQ